MSRQRSGQQLGMLMAGYWALRSDAVVSHAEAEAIATELGIKQTNAERISEEFECLTHLLTLSVKLDEGASNETATIEQIIFNKSTGNGDGHERELRKYGLILRGDSLYISNYHAWLKKQFDQTKWPDYIHFLRRVKGSEKVSHQRFGDDRQRCLRIPLSAISTYLNSPE